MPSSSETITKASMLMGELQQLATTTTKLIQRPQNSTSRCYILGLRSPVPSPCQDSNRLRVSMIPITIFQISPVGIQCRAVSQLMSMVCSIMLTATKLTTSLMMRFRTCAQSSKCLIQIARVRLKSKTWKRSWVVCNETQMRSENLSIDLTPTRTAVCPSMNS